MRRSTKILAVVLTFVLLVGALATAAIAATTLPTITGDGINKKSEQTFTGIEAYFDSTAKNDKNPSATNLSFANYVDGKGYGALAQTVTVGENTYLQVQNPAVASAASGAYVAVDAHGKYGGIDFTTDFAVLDFDFCADMYIALAEITGIGGTVYAKGDLIDPADLPEETDPSKYTLSYNSRGISFGLNVMYVSPLFMTSRDTATNTWYLKDNTSVWWSGTSYFGLNAPLSNNVGEWNHVTIIFDEVAAEKTEDKATNYANYTNTTIYVYVNGEYAGQSTVGAFNPTPNSAQAALSEIRVGYDGRAGKTSVGVDNFTAYTYNKGYTGKLATAFEGDAYPENIAHLDDIVFGNNYQYEAPNQYVASIGDTYYYTVDAALAALEPDCELHLYNGAKVENYVAKFAFKVICPEGDFSLGACNYICERSTEFEGYAIKLPTNSVNVFFFDVISDDVEDFEDPATIVTVAAGQKVVVPEIAVVGDGELIGNTIMVHNGWYLEGVDDGMQYEIDHTFTQDEIDSAVNFYAFPTFEEVSVLFDITDGDGNALAEKLDCDDPAIIPEIIAANVGKTINITLLADVNHYYKFGDFITLTDNTNLNIDLAGHQWTAVCNSTDTNYITIAAGSTSTVNIYSTAAGGSISFFTAYKDSLETAFVYNAGTNSKVNFGSVNGADGANLSVMCAFLYGQDTDITADLKINGGNYFRSVEAAAIYNGFITARKGTLNVDIDNALIKADSFLSTVGFKDTANNNVYHSYEDATINATVDGSDILGAADRWGSRFSVLFYFNAKSTVTFKNTDICGALDGNTPAEYWGNVILGDGTRYGVIDSPHGSYSINVPFKLAENCYSEANNETYDFSAVTMPAGITYRYDATGTAALNVTFNADGSYTSTNTAMHNNIAKGSFVAKIIETTSVKVTLVNGDTETEVTVVGNTINGDVPELAPLGSNIFFKIAHTGWSLEGTTTKADLTKAQNGERYVPYFEPVVNVQSLAGLKMQTRMEMLTYVPTNDSVNNNTYVIGDVTYVVSNVQTSNNYGKTPSGTATLNGVDYNGYVANFNTFGKNVFTSLGSVVTTITFDVTFGETTVTLKQEVKNPYSMYAYYEKAFAAYPDDASRKLLADTARYAISVFEYQAAANSWTDTSLETFKTLINDTYGEYLTDISGDFGEENALTDYMTDEAKAVYAGIKLLIGGNKSNNAVYFALKPIGDEPYSADFSAPDFATMVGDKIVYQNWSSGNIFAQDAEDKYEMVTDDGYRSYGNNHYKLYVLDQTFTVTTYLVQDDQDSAFTFEYNLATYIKAIEGEDAAAANVVRALIAAARSSANYIIENNK